MEIETNFNSRDPNDLSPETTGSPEQSLSNSSSMEVVLKDLAAGSIAGVANVLSGHPFDTIKVRMQMLNTTLTGCVKNIAGKEGLKSFYKGVYSPLYSVPAINAVVFGAYETAKRFISTDSDMTLYQGMIAGAWAGLLNCVVVTPVELIKCRQQMEGMGSKAKTSSSWVMMRQIIQREGFSGLYRGNLITIFREMPAYAAQFGSYEIIKNFLSTKYGESGYINFISGGLAGFCCWVASYPQDVIKTKLQCDFGIGGNSRYPSARFIKDGGIISCAKDIYRHEGLRGFWRGFSACTMRAGIANAFTFVAYEEAKKLFI